MKRRTFLKNATAAALTPAAIGQVSQSTPVRRIAFGGIQIECSTYGHNRTRLIDFRVRRGQALADDPFFASSYRQLVVDKDWFVRRNALR